MEMRQAAAILNFGNINNLIGEVWRSGNNIALVTDLSAIFSKSFRLPKDLSLTCFLRRGTLLAEVNGIRCIATAEEILSLRSSDIVLNPSISDDIDGYILFVSVNRMIEFSNQIDIHRSLLYMRKHPVISLDEKMRLRVNAYLYLLSDIIHKTDSDMYSPYVCGNLINALFAELSAAILALAKEYNTTRSGRRESIYRDFMMILSTLPVRPRIVKWYAEQLCVSPKYLSEICKTQSGRSATEWIKEYAIIDINRMMTTTDLSIKQIAFELKYPNLPFFGKCVRRWFGLSPTELRNKLRSG